MCPPLSAGGLSQREGEVLKRIARAYSNMEIAVTMAVSVKTVEKLNIRSRVDVVRYAARVGWLTDDGPVG